MGSTRFVDMELSKGACMNNYYWLEGPLSGDHGRRILVLHNGQASQCSHCLRKAGPGGCPAGGNGKACDKMNTPRGKMLQYMQSLRAHVGYVSIKVKYTEMQARNFPSLPGFDTDISRSMEENLDGEEYLVPNNPIEEKDRRIAALEQNVEKLKTKEDEISNLKKDLAKSKLDHKIALKKIDFTQKATEQRLLDSISSSEGFRSDPVLIGVYSATLDENEFNFEESKEDEPKEAKMRRSRKDEFLKDLEEKLDPSSLEQKKRFKDIKNQVLERVKSQQVSRNRSRSISNKRSLSPASKLCGTEKSPVRPRTQIPK